MSESLSKSEHLEKLEEAAKRQKDPTLDASVKLLGSVERTVTKQNERIDDMRDEMAENISALREDNEATKTALVEGQTNLINKIQAMEKRQLLSSGVTAGGKYPEDVLREALGQEGKALAYHSERSGFFLKDNPVNPEREALLTAATEQWFKLAARMQLPAFMSQRESTAKDKAKLDEAFAELARTKAALSTTQSTLGGAGVPTIVGNEVLRLVLDAGVIVGRARHIPMTSKTLQLPSEATAVSVYWPSEGATLTQGEPTFGTKTLTANKLIGRALATSELIQDEVFGVIPYLQNIFAEKMARELDTQAMEGSGSPFTGVVGASGVNSVNVTTGTAGGGSLAYADLVTAMFKAGEMSSRVNGIWVMNPVMYGIVLGLVDTSGQPIVKYGTVESAPAGTILGRPVYTSNALSVAITVGSDATGNLYFGPPQALIFGDRRQMSFAISEHAQWATDKLDFRIITRVGYVVGVPSAWTKIVQAHSD